MTSGASDIACAVVSLSAIGLLILLFRLALTFARRGLDHTVNDWPQPQVVAAFGFRMMNCAPCKSSL